MQYTNLINTTEHGHSQPIFCFVTLNRSCYPPAVLLRVVKQEDTERYNKKMCVSPSPTHTNKTNKQDTYIGYVAIVAGNACMQVIRKKTCAEHVYTVANSALH